MTGNRAQTTLDFAIAMGVFLLAVAFVFTFVPSLTAPFADSDQEHTAVADRVANHLAEGALADPNEPYVLDVTCATAFFEPHDDPSADHCGFTNDAVELEQRIGVSDRPSVNVTVERIDDTTQERTVLCDDDGTIVEVTDCDPGEDGVVAYRIGDDPEGVGSITVARRVVSVDGTDATLFVRVW